MSRRRAFNYRSTAEEVSEGVDLSGRNALVTGANSGLGKETTRVLALRGASVTLACRDLAKAEQARKDILEQSGGDIAPEQLDLLQLDLNSLTATQEAADSFCSWNRPLHLLVNNAGIMIPMERRTEDGFEAHLGINHLGHFLFTWGLLAPLLAAGGARVVCLSSAAMGFASLTRKLEDLNWERRRFRGFPSYGDSKLMNLMFARELTLRYADKGIVANALHPGVIGTELARDQSLPFMALGLVALPFMKSVPQGAATSVFAATSEDYEGRGGLYFKNSREARPEHKLAADDEVCETLWDRSAELVGID